MSAPAVAPAKRLKLTGVGAPGPVGSLMAGMENDLVDGAALAGILDMVISAFAQALHPVIRRIEALEAAPKGLQYCGVWRDGGDYLRGHVVTKGGAMWCCLADHSRSTPGTDASFQLCVKSGRDGKDGRDLR